MRSETGKLPKGQAYPLRPSALEGALAKAGIAIDTHLIRAPGMLFDAHFWPPNADVPHERLYVRAGSVPLEEAATARRQVEDVLIPTLVGWIADILGRDCSSPVRREQQVLHLKPD